MLPNEYMSAKVTLLSIKGMRSGAVQRRLNIVVVEVLQRLSWSESLKSQRKTSSALSMSTMFYKIDIRASRLDRSG
jgi:hypothetical protein